MRNYRWPLQVYKVKEHKNMSYFRVIPPPPKKEWIWAVPNNILQPLPLVDYLGPGRGEKNKMIRQRV